MFEDITSPYAKPIINCIESLGDKLRFITMEPKLPELIVLGREKITQNKLKGLSFVLKEAKLETKGTCYLACEDTNLLKALEGLDPKKTICIDNFSYKLLLDTYKTKISKPEFLEGVCFVFGRPTLLFSDLEKAYLINRIKCLKKLERFS